MRLHPTENRGFRELHVMAREIVVYWGGLANRLVAADPNAAQALEKGAEQARRLIDELRPRTAALGVHGGAGVQGAGKLLATARSGLRDPFLERNQALRLAVGDAEHVGTLCAYLTACAERRADTDAAEFFAGWERRMRRLVGSVRKVAVAQAADPDSAIEPVVDSPFGRAAHKVSHAFGTLGEWSDRRAAERRVS